MRCEDNDPTLRTLGHLAVLEPDRARSDRVRMRCRAAIWQHQNKTTMASGRPTALGLESVLTYALSVGYLSAVIHDLLRVYMRR
jgi:hypothetical protein